MSDTKFTPGPWRQGTTLNTSQTRKWSQHEREENERRENRMVFTGFTAADEGRSRRLVAVCETAEDAHLIAAAPELYAALEAFVNNSSVQTNQPDECEKAEATLAKARGDQ